MWQVGMLEPTVALVICICMTNNNHSRSSINIGISKIEVQQDEGEKRLYTTMTHAWIVCRCVHQDPEIWYNLKRIRSS